MAAREKRPVVKWTHTAEIQFFGILNYWIDRNRSTVYADKLSQTVWDRLQFLSQNPDASISTEFPDTRKAAMGHYSIIYRKIETGILILAFWDNRQNPKKLYELLNKKR